MWKSFILPTALLAGTIIGSGMFSLPYVMAQSGIGVWVLFLLLFTAVYVGIHLMYADVVVREGDNHRLAGFARRYLGRWGYGVAIVVSIVQMLLVLTIYIVLAVSFSARLDPFVNPLYGALIFWVLSSLVIFVGTRRFAAAEFLATLGIALVIGISGIMGIPSFSASTLPLLPVSAAGLLLPFGAFLFALNGRTAVPTLVHYFNREKLAQRGIKRSIIWGTLLPAILYIGFTFGIMGLSGGQPSADSLSGLPVSLPAWFIVSLVVLGLFSLWSSYFAIGKDVKNSLQFDLKFSSAGAGALVLFVPLALYFLGFVNFIQLVEVVGGVFVSLELLLVLFIWLRSRAALKTRGIIIKRVPPFLFWGTASVLVLGFVYAVAEHLGILH